ncbi:MAG: right-handed parallel beta-helix repeat-containing protein [Lentisphaerae bacterium]|jgi:hypothetical protein|nr:right-handed parallel beta-helix repeat-containing protein [Lentisphaerota bacterium]MBT4814287.1 right-handed parallel beta-helix repeat-containing protein [Lentisphaerota bacterium]MBT5612321.1 right-handed parallel beta-helix repeat-containing protein [Lentisphaerota bacterium]MBT7056625.1 right-handed parallel beta-helix repeat-containing protein [Lentisphaerota bacterium]MBT7840550.1 right-handed parallel beta-helix repeat-containing protein [Lentisphaerota bacterium]
MNYTVSPNGDDQNAGTTDAPFATLIRARDAIRELPETDRRQDIGVTLRGGTYRLDRTLVLGLADSAPEGGSVTFRAAAGETPVLSGGVTITGWTKLTDYPAELPATAQGNVWVADLPGGLEDFHALFDGDRRLVRARSEDFTFDPPEYVKADSQNVMHNADRHLLRQLRFPKGLLRNWSYIRDVEAFFNPVPWCLNFIALDSVDEEAGVAWLSCEANSPPFSNAKHSFAWLENAIAFLEGPGQWVLNSSERRLYYWPETGEPGEGIAAPGLKELVRVEGDIRYDVPEDVPVRGIGFRGITFRHADRSVWTRDRKGWGLQHDWDTFDHPNALLRFRGAEDCAVDQCRFTASGGSGVRLDLHCQGIRVTNSLIDDVGHMGVLLAGYGPGTKDVNRRNTIHNNIIHHCGQIIWHGHAVFLWQSGDNQITHNWIHDVPRKAVGVAGTRCQILEKPDCDFDEASKTIRWHEIRATIASDGDPQDRYMPFLHARNNLIAHNRVTRTMQKLSDGASLNVSGAGSGNVVSHNLIYDVPSGVRTDDWQRGTTTANNIVIRAKTAFIHKDFNEISNNIIVDCVNGIRFRPFPQQSYKPGAAIRHNVHVSGDPDYAAYNTHGWPDSMDIARAGTRDLPCEMDMRQNLYCCPGAREFVAQQQTRGIEEGSAAGESPFADAASGDLRICSPADLEQIGFSLFDADPGAFGTTDQYPPELQALDDVTE